MLYQAYQAQADIMTSLRGVAGIALQGFGQLREHNPYLADSKPTRSLEAGYELLGRVGLTHERPPWGIDTVRVGRRDVSGRARRPPTSLPVRHAAALRQGVRRPAPRARCRRCCSCRRSRATSPRSCAAPCETLLPEQDVWITDWHNARDVALADGSFGFDAYIEYLIRWLEVLGPETHVIAVCQPCVAALVATAVMAEAGNPATPAHAHADGRPDRHPGRPHRGQRPRHQQAHRVVRAQRDHHRAVALRRRPPPGLPRVPPARVVPHHEPRPPPERAPRALPAPRRRRRAGGRGHRGLLRRVLRGARPHRRVLPGDGGVRVPGAPPGPRRARVPGPPGRSRRDPAHRAAHRRGRARRHLLTRARRSPPTTCAATSGRCASATTCSPASGTTACSTAAGGSSRSTRWCTT